MEELKVELGKKGFEVKEMAKIPTIKKEHIMIVKQVNKGTTWSKLYNKEATLNTPIPKFIGRVINEYNADMNRFGTQCL